MVENNINNNIILIICGYCGISDCDRIDKSRNIEIIHSQDNKLSYAILNNAALFLNESGDSVASLFADNIV